LVIIISYPTSAGEINVALTTPPKYEKKNENENENSPKVARTLTMFVEHGVMAHIP